MKKILSAIAVLAVALGVTAQTPVDALNLSHTQYGSTARSAALGGAFGALGGDFSSISINPAGLGVYRGGEFSFTTGVGIGSSSSDYLNITSLSDKNVDFNFDNLGLVFSIPTLKDKGIMSVNLSIGYNRLKDYNRSAFIQGASTSTSQLGYYASDIAELGLDNSLWDSYLAYQAYLVDMYDDGEGGQVVEPILVNGTEVLQDESIFEKGRIDEWNFSLAFNWDHKLYAGVSLGVRDIFYRKEVVYGEVFVENSFGDTYSQWDEASSSYIFYNGGGYTSSSYLSTTGTGVNAKLGLIYRPTENLRLGFAFHTPTYYSLNDDYSYENDPNIYVPDQNNPGGDIRPDIQKSGLLDYKYNVFSSPLNMELSVAYTLGKYGAFSIDYGISSYDGMSLGEKGQTTGFYTNYNALISEMYGLGTSLRTGLELKATPNFSLRAGYARYDAGLTNEANNYSFDKPGAINQFSGGMGYRDNGFFIDFAYVYQTQSVEHSLYILDNTEPTAQIDYNRGKAMITLGFRF